MIIAKLLFPLKRRLQFYTEVHCVHSTGVNNVETYYNSAKLITNREKQQFGVLVDKI